MKRSILILTILILAGASSVFAQEGSSEKQIKKDSKFTEVQFSCKMNCDNCANKVKKQLAFTKGVKYVETDYEKDIVTVKYRTGKTDNEKIIESLDEIGYKASVVKPCSSTKTGCGQKTSGCGGCNHNH